jgi:menaquinone-9 beta-reductase
VTAKEVEFRDDPAQQQGCAARGDTPELWFCRDLKGYGWMFPQGRVPEYRPGARGQPASGEHLAEFVASMQAAGRLPADLPARYKGHAYLLYGHARRPLAGRAACWSATRPAWPIRRAARASARRWNRR